MIHRTKYFRPHFWGVKRQFCPSDNYCDWELFNTGLTWQWYILLDDMETKVLGQLASVWRSVLVSDCGRERGQELDLFLPPLLDDLILFLVLWSLCSVFVIWSNNSLVKTGRISGGNWSSVMPLCHLNCKNSWFYQILGEKNTQRQNWVWTEVDSCLIK